MSPLAPLDTEALGWCCPADEFEFATTAELPDFEGTIGQERPLEALQFALAMPRAGYHAYALGSHGLGKHATVRQLLEDRAAAEPVPDDLAYVADFDEPRTPRLLRLPAGRGRVLERDVRRLLSDLLPALRNAFENEQYRTRRQAIEEELKERQQRAVGEVEENARARSVALMRTPAGFAFAPIADGRVITPEAYQELPEHVRKHIEGSIEELQKALQRSLADLPAWTKETRDKLRALNDETAAFAVGFLFAPLLPQYERLPEVHRHLQACRTDIVENVEAFLQIPEQGAPTGPIEDRHPHFRRYRVNLLVDHAETRHAPIVYEDDPTHDRLFGRIEQRAEMGALVTDLLMIRAGALHEANGGFLILDAEKLLTRPFAYEGLKRALLAGEIRIESPLQSAGILTTVTLEPQPAPLEVKIVLIGERLPYYLLSAYDPEFGRLFKVAADFDERVPREPGSCRDFARLVGTTARREKLRPFERTGVARVLEHLARQADDRGKLSADIEDLEDLLREADYRAGRRGGSTVGAEDVQAAVDGRARRLGRVKELAEEQIVEGTVAIATSGAVSGQINGLAVMQLGGFSFGRPSRITARVRMGSGSVIDIEREVRLGGPLHSKGVLILSSFLAASFVPDLPLSLSASLVFEQSYGGVDGDSASSAELYALLSAIAEVPIRQCFAVTGSVNQKGEVQAIGGVNEKIEGFFDLCAARGLDGSHGVLVPATNRRHLMLHERVRRAVAAQRFSVYAIATVEEGIELLTGMPAGTRQADGLFPEGTVYRRVEDRLRAMAERRRDFGRGGDTERMQVVEAPPADPSRPPEPPPLPPGPRPPGPLPSGNAR
jgi:predicted ATP-dependent protease